METSSRIALTSLSRLLIGLLARTGVTDIVTSPGSRSTPYLMAALEHGGLRVHSVVDERSAGFVALGLARASSRATALLCTSGTAAANYLPAVVEARLSEVPLIVLTADRPLTLQGCSAPQTIDQTRLYGTHVVAAASLTVPRDLERELVLARRQILSVLAKALGPEPGPVHLNLHTPKPLELVREPDAQRDFVQRVIAGAPADLTRRVGGGSDRLSESAIEQLCVAVHEHRRGIITCGFEPRRGQLNPLLLARFARVTGYSVLVDACNPLRLEAPAALKPFMVAPFEPLLRIPSWYDLVAPELVIQMGRPLLSTAFERWLTTATGDRKPPRLIALARRGWPDPTGLAEFLGNADPNDTLERALGRLEPSPPRATESGNPWLVAARAVERGIDAWFEAANPRDDAELGELAAVHVLLRALPADTRLVLGNSLSVRQIDLLASIHTPTLQAESLRGASGIDGVVSTGAGFALADDLPTTLLLGDISLLHDVGGLWAASRARVPLVIVVLNNGGGRIFEQLPVVNAVDRAALEHWTTPQRLDLGLAAALYGIAHVRAANTRSLVHALEAAHRREGATLIEVIVADGSAKSQADEVVAEVHRALAQLGAV